MNKVKKIISVFGIIVALFFTSMVNAEVKIAAVDVMSVFQRMPQREIVGKALEKEFSAQIKSLQAEEKQASEANARLKKDGLTLSSSEKAKLGKIITDFEDNLNDYRIKFEKRESEEKGKLLTKIQGAVKDIVASEKYDIVLKAEALLFASDAVDITDKVLEKVKE